jgi:hypothetical protein
MSAMAAAKIHKARRFMAVRLSQIFYVHYTLRNGIVNPHGARAR